MRPWPSLVGLMSQSRGSNKPSTGCVDIPKTDPAIKVQALNTQVLNHCYSGDYAAVDAASAEALQLARAHLDDRSRETAAATVQRAVVLRQAERLEEAQALYEQGLELYAHLQSRVHPYHGTLLHNLALIQRDRGHVMNARTTFQAADNHYLEALGEASSLRVPPLVALAQLSAQKGQHAAAVSEYRQAVKVALASGRIPYILGAATALGQYLVEQDSCNAGEDLLLESHEIRPSQRGGQRSVRGARKGPRGLRFPRRERAGFRRANLSGVDHASHAAPGAQSPSHRRASVSLRRCPSQSTSDDRGGDG